MLKSLRLCAVLSTASLLMLSPGARAQDAAINATGAAANASAILDLNVGPAGVGGAIPFRGLLIPRMLRSDRVGIIAPANGLWVYQTNDVAPDMHGLWYYDANCACPGGAWIKLPGGLSWNLAGNAGTIAGTHYLGTADANDLVLRTNNTPWMRLTSTGQMGINIPAPSEAVQVNGGMRLYAPGANNLTNQAGVIRFNTTPPAGTANTYHEGNTTGAAAGWGRLENAERRVNGASYTGTIMMCGTGSAQTPINSSSTGLTNTCFPTAQKNAKIQYLYLASELTTWGLCPGIITKLEITVLADDPQNPPPGAALQLECTIHATALGSIPTFDAATSAAPTNFFSPLPNVPVGSGQYVMDLTQPGNSTFNWNGVSNLIVEICWTRGFVAGINPGIQLNTAAFVATRYGYDALANVGCNMTECPCPPGTPGTATKGTQMTRAAIKWFGQAMVPTPILASGDFLTYDGGLMVEKTAGWAATVGNFKGPGTISAEVAVYDGNVALSDHVFDRYFDGAVSAQDVPAASRYNYVELDRLKDYLAENRHLPSMPSRAEFETRGKPSLGELGTELWQTVETQAIYIAQLEKDLSILEEMAYDKSMTDAELAGLIARVQGNPRLNAGQKEHLIAGIRERNDRSNQH